MHPPASADPNSSGTIAQPQQQQQQSPQQHRRRDSTSSDPMVYARSASQYHAQLLSDQQLQQQRATYNDTSPPKASLKLPAFNHVMLSLEPPNLYKTALQLSSEIDLQNWWYATIDILSHSSFYASRACLSLPQDPSDPYHTPWGVKAVYSKCEQNEDSDSNPNDVLQQSDGYFSRTSLDNVDNSHCDKPKIPSLPLCFESLQPFDRDEEPLVDKNSVDRIIRRGHTIVLSRQYRQNSTQSSDPDNPFYQQNGSGMFKRTLLEKLDSYHHHHQIHHQQHAPPGIQVQQTGHERRKELLRRRSSNIVPLAKIPTVDTPCLNLHGNAQAANDAYLFQEHEILPHSSGSSGENDDNANHNTVQGVREQFYDEYEQAQPSPWSQSPAPSPVMMDPNVNPFFQTPIGIDDDAFNPTSPESYHSSSVPYPVPVGNMHSVVHIPIYHQAGRNPGKIETGAPFAILSFLSAVVPYPQVLISSIDSLVPFIATSLSTCLAHQQLNRQLFYYRHHDSGNTAMSASDTQSPANALKLGDEISPETASSDPLSPEQSRKSDMTTDTDSATPTPTAHGAVDHQRGPFSAGGLAMIRKNMMEAVEEDFNTQDGEPDFDSNYDKNINSIVPFNATHTATKETKVDLSTVPNQLTPEQDMSTNCSSKGISPSTAASTPDSSASASPLSSAIRDGWDAISPTTGLPIVSSIPPSSLYKWRSVSSGSSAYESESALSSSEKPKRHHRGGSIQLHAPTPIHPTAEAEDDVLASDEADEPPEKPKPKVKRARKHKKTMEQAVTESDDNENAASAPPVMQSRHFFEALDGLGDVETPNATVSDTQKESKGESSMIMPKSRLLRLIIDGIPIHVFTCSTRTGRTTWVNSRVMQYSGQSMRAHLGSRWLDHMHIEDRPVCRRQWKDAFERGVGCAGQYRLKRFDGEYRYFLWRTVPLRDVKGKIINWFGSCTDIHDEQVAKELCIRQLEIEHNERKYRLLAETIPQLVFTFSPEFGVTYANQKWEDYSGKPLEGAKGLSFMTQVHSEDRHKLKLPDLPDEDSSGVCWQEEVRLQGKDGEYRWFLIKCISVQQNEIADARWFGTCTDINDQKLFEHKLKEAHDAAQKSTESKTRFLSNMSHEIRTPLIGITGMINFMLDSDLTPEQLDYAHTIQQSAESLLVVINDILDLSKVEAGMMKLEMEPFSLTGMVEDANELLSTLAIQKGLEMSFWVDEDVPDVVIGDRIRLRQVLLNLIGNAIKFTTSGEVYTKCSVHKPVNSDSEIMLMFEVVDTGSGFDADGEAVMFKPFSQVDASSTRKHGGSGLGLVISRQLSELHGGGITCTSRKGEGSTFYLTVKFTIPPHTTQPRPHTPQEETINSPFFRASAFTMHSSSASSHSIAESPFQKQMMKRPSLDAAVFGSSSPLEHSIKHSQVDGVTSSAKLQEALLYKTAPSGGLLHTGANQLNPDATADFAGAVKNRDLSSKISRELQLPKAFRTSADDIKESAEESSSGPTIQLTPIAPVAPRALIVSEWTYSRDVVVQHVKKLMEEAYEKIEQLDICHSHVEALQILTNPDKLPYSWIVINLSMQQYIMPLIRHINSSPAHKDAITVVLTTHLQRSTIFDGVHDDPHNDLFDHCEFVFKPLKRSKIEALFPSPKEGAQSGPPRSSKMLRNKCLRRAVPSAQETVTSQQEVFKRMVAEVGNRGHRVLLVEDNLVNQKVMIRYLMRVGLEVDVVSDGSQCVDAVLSHPHDYYCLVLCDLFMPVKDGYEATREIRQWEDQNLKGHQVPIPIIALSANVMSDVAGKCKAVGFSDYISKPVNFSTLSQVVRGYILQYEQRHGHNDNTSSTTTTV